MRENVVKCRRLSSASSAYAEMWLGGGLKISPPDQWGSRVSRRRRCSGAAGWCSGLNAAVPLVLGYRALGWNVQLQPEAPSKSRNDLQSKFRHKNRLSAERRAECYLWTATSFRFQHLLTSLWCWCPLLHPPADHMDVGLPALP